MDKNTSTELADDGEVTEVEGPFGFGPAIKLVDGCIHTPEGDNTWTRYNDSCISDPSKCEDGISLSIFEKVKFTDTITSHGERYTENKKYIISTGGELGVPGVAIYHSGYNLVALVSTGDQLWNVSVPGLLRNNTWNNIAIRWRAPDLDDDGTEAMDRGGLELLVNLQTVAAAIEPTNKTSTVSPALTPPELMIGCHRTTSSAPYRDFGTGEYDEAAAWTHYVPKNKTLMFLGGFDESSSGMTSDDFEEILKQIDVTDPKQAKAVVNQLIKMTADEPAVAAEEIAAEQPASDTAAGSSGGAAASGSSSAAAQPPPSAEEVVAKKEAAAVAKMETLARLIDMMTTEVKKDVTKEEIESFFGLMAPMSNLLNPAKQETWAQLQEAPEKSGAAGIVEKWEKWVMGNLDSLQLDAGSNDTMDLVTTSPSMVMETEKILLDDLRAKYNHTFITPNYNAWGTIGDAWNQPKDRVAVPLNIFQDCGNEYVNLMTICYNTYAEIAPMRVNPIYIGNENGIAAQMDSRVCSVEVRASTGQNGNPTKCRVNETLLKENPVESYFQHGSKIQAQYKYPQRSLMEFQLEDEPKYLVKVRHCVYWNPNISDYGSWDAKNCRVLDSGPDFTKCSCSVMGTMGIIAEHFVEESIPEEPMWLQVIRYTGYTLSIICLIIFICTIALSKHLKEDFHIMRMHMALSMLLGMLAMLLTDVNMLRVENIACIALSSCMHYFFTACAAWLAMESYAAFKAVTQGVISGKLWAYMPIAYGVPLISLGVSYVLASYSYGTDPRCMVSLDPGAKWMMFGPLIALSGVGFLLAGLVACNLNTPAMRRDNVVTELSPVCQGLTFLMFYFTFTWCIGIPAYFNFNLAVSFYPLFQVLHCFMGVLVLLFLGLYSPRFRFVIKGQASKRSKWLRLYAMGHAVDPEKLDEEPILSHTQDFPKHSPETPHKRVFVA